MNDYWQLLFEKKITESQFAYLSISCSEGFVYVSEQKASAELRKSVKLAPDEFSKVQSSALLNKVRKETEEGKI